MIDKLDRQDGDGLLQQPQYIVEGIILRRLHEKRIEGYTIETAKEIADAIAPPKPAPDAMRTGVEHDLKTWPEFFEEVVAGRKPFEVRFNDRNYRVGDVLRLREWSPQTSAYSGRETRQLVSYCMSDRFGVDKDHVIMGLAALSAPVPPAGVQSGASEREALQPFFDWADRNRGAVPTDSMDELIRLARKACDRYTKLSRQATHSISKPEW